MEAGMRDHDLYKLMVHRALRHSAMTMEEI